MRTFLSLVYCFLAGLLFLDCWKREVMTGYFVYSSCSLLLSFITENAELSGCTFVSLKFSVIKDCCIVNYSVQLRSQGAEGPPPRPLITPLIVCCSHFYRQSFCEIQQHWLFCIDHALIAVNHALNVKYLLFH